MSARSNILSALQSKVENLGGGFKRNAGLPSKVPAGGLIIMRDGAPGEPEYTLSPLRETYKHCVMFELFVAELGNEAVLYALEQAILTAIKADQSLGTLVDDITASPIEVEAIQTEYGTEILGARLPVYLHYTVPASL